MMNNTAPDSPWWLYHAASRTGDQSRDERPRLHEYPFATHESPERRDLKLLNHEGSQCFYHIKNEFPLRQGIF